MKTPEKNKMVTEVLDFLKREQLSEFDISKVLSSAYRKNRKETLRLKAIKNN